MVLLFAGRGNPAEHELIKILAAYGAGYISDRVIADGDSFTLVSEYKRTDLNIKSGIAVMLDNTDRFAGQRFPAGMTGICEDTNQQALKLFMASGIPVVSCGMNNRNTITLSSLDSDTLLVTLQRTLIDRAGKTVEPGEFRIRLNGSYSPYSVMAATAVLLLRGITPEAF